MIFGIASKDERFIMHPLKRLDIESQACTFFEYLVFAASPKPPRAFAYGGVSLIHGCGAESNTRWIQRGENVPAVGILSLVIF